MRSLTLIPRQLKLRERENRIDVDKLQEIVERAVEQNAEMWNHLEFDWHDSTDEDELDIGVHQLQI